VSLLTIAGVDAWIRDYIPNCPQPQIIRKLNMILSEIHEEIAQQEWTTFTTKAPVTTGTVAVTNGSTAVTFSNSVLNVAATDGLVFLKIDADPNGTWFPLTYVSGTTGTLASKYAGTTDAAATYRIVYPTVVFPANVGQILYVQDRTGKLEMATRENAEMRASSDIVGKPRWWGPYTHDPAATPDDAHRIITTPFADATYSYECLIMTRPTYLGAGDSGGTKIDLPALFDKAVLYGTLALCWSQEDGESKFGPWWGRYQKALAQARSTSNAEVSGRRLGALGRRRGGRNMDYYDGYATP
jgi:hypothetical protein